MKGRLLIALLAVAIAPFGCGEAMAKLNGTVAIVALPPYRGLIVSLCLFSVANSEDPAPYNADPPPDASTDCEVVFEKVDLNEESRESTFETHFRVERLPGYYYLQVRVILFREKDGKVFAQVEPFFFARRPVRIAAGEESHITLPVSWPPVPLEELQSYGKVSPQRKNP